MAHVTSGELHELRPFPLRIGEAVLNVLIRIAEANPRMREIERLQGLSDDALAKRNIRREDIVRHVFRDVYYI